ncbi:hypothetical protein TFUB20_00208 [Tannerella forsythia]|uniref:Uncharacterized protein n=1 Tax=Tannerella forsythia TaxID=28112 RepID=A0A1D3UCY5_TANFO|nr:hypothetical protein TFUB20_00208 [Tannerella forsythia]
MHIAVIHGAAPAASLISGADFSHAAVRTSQIVGAQERIVTCTFILQTTVVQLDIIVGAYEYATAGTVSFVLEVLQVYIITFFFASAVTYFREVAEIFGLSQEQQATRNRVRIERITHINIAEARTERHVTRILRILEIDQAAFVQDNIPARTGIDLQIALVTTINQAGLRYFIP